MIARGELELEVELESDTAAPERPGRRPPRRLGRRPLPARPDPRRPRHRARRAGPHCRGRHHDRPSPSIPIRPEVAGACEILGIDPIYVANEGKLIAVVAPDAADAALAALRSHPLGREAAIVAEVTEEPPGLVSLETAFGGSRVVDMLAGDPLPRIC